MTAFTRNPTARPIRANPHPMRGYVPLVGQDAEYMRFLELRRARASNNTKGAGRA